MHWIRKSVVVCLIFLLIASPFSTYSGQPVQAAASTSNDLFFSEYVEGSSYNKAIELYNGTGDTIDLSHYTLELYTNGNEEVNTTEALTGTLAAGDVYVVAHSSADQTLLDRATQTSGVVNFNGNDAIVLKKDDTIIDTIGTIGEDSEFAKDKTLVRKAEVSDGSTTYTETEWDSFTKDTFDYLGAYGDEPIPVEPDPVPTEPISIADAKLTANGQQVMVEGTVLADSNAFGTYSTYIQDESAAINLYQSSQGSLPSLAKGDHIQVVGELTEYKGLKEIEPISIEIIGNENLPDPVSLTIADLQKEEIAEQYEGQLAQVTGYISSVPDNASGGGYNISFIDADYNSTTLRVMEETMDSASIEAGNWYQVTAVVSQYDSYQLLPRQANDITLANEQPEAPTAAGEYSATVRYVSDGDTIRLETPVLGSDRVRFINIDTPETSVPGANGVDEENQKLHGEAATAYLESLLQAGDEITLKIGEEPTDDYGRLLAEVVNKEGINTNLEMVKQGYATSYFIWPIGDQNTYEKYQMAVREAKDQARGIWDQANPLKELPFEYRAISEGGDFHRFVGNSDTKTYVQPTEWEQVPVDKRIFFASASEAEEQGYTAAEGEIENPDQLLEVQLLSMNDLHGKIDQSYELEMNGETATYGRIDYTAQAIKEREQMNENTLLIHAGDMIGGSSPVSALLQDEPTVEIMNQMGFDVGTVGNHEFDEGIVELKRMINGGDHPDGIGTQDYQGMDMDLVCANCIEEDTGETFLPPYVVEEVNGVSIGFIGVNTQDTMNMVMPASLENVGFTNEVAAVNDAAEELQDQGVEAIVVLAHMSASQSGQSATGAAADLANNVNDAVDVIFAAHNHEVVNAVVDGKTIVQASEYGKAFADVDLMIDTESKDIVDVTSEVVFVKQSDYQPETKVKNILDHYLQEVEPIINEEIGYNAQALSGQYTNDGDHGLGNLIADGMKWAMDADFAMHNGGGIRDSLNEGPITWGEVFNILPFANSVMSVEIKGADLIPILNDNLSSYGSDYSVAGLHYTYNYDYQHVVDITFPDGTPIDPEETYTLAVNNYIGTQDGPISNLGTNEQMGPIDVDAAVDYIKHLATTEANPLVIGSEGRIAQTNEIPEIDVDGEVIGYNSMNLSGSYTNGKDHGLGNLITDSMKAAMNSDFAVTNGGGIGSSLLAGEITKSTLERILTHGNTLVKLSVTGEQLEAILNAQLSANGSDYSVAGFHYQYDPNEQKVVAISLPSGEAVDPEATYSLTTNSYLAERGVFSSIDSEREQGPVDVEALEEYIVSLATTEAEPLIYQSEGRISTKAEDQGDTDQDTDEEETPSEEEEQDSDNTGELEIVQAKATVVNGQATITDDTIDPLQSEGTLQIDVKEEEAIAVHFTKQQINALKAKNATIKIMLNTTMLTIPSSEFGNEETTVDIEEVDQKSVNGEGAISDIFNFTIRTGGQVIDQFDKPITLEFLVSETDIEDTANLKVYYYNPETKAWEMIGGTYANGYVTATTTHFSTFGVFEATANDTEGSDEQTEEPTGTTDYGENSNNETTTNQSNQTNGNTLPSTASMMFNWMLAGTILLLMSVVTYAIYRKKQWQ